MEKTMEMADILIHVHEELSIDGRQKIEKDLQSRSGIISAHFSKHQVPMLKMVYVPGTITSAGILKHVLDHGVHASLIGF